MQAQHLVTQMVTERDENRLSVHVHFVTQRQHFFGQLRLALRSGMRLQFQEEHQRGSLLRLSEVFAQGGYLVAIGKRAGAHLLEGALLRLHLRFGDFRSVKDHERIVHRQMSVQFHGIGPEFLGVFQGRKRVFKCPFLGIESPVRHDFRLCGHRQRQHHRKEREE